MENLLDAKELIGKLSKAIHGNRTKGEHLLHATSKTRGDEHLVKIMEEKNQEMKTRILIVESKLSRLEVELDKYKEDFHTPTKRTM